MLIQRIRKKKGKICNPIHSVSNTKRMSMRELRLSDVWDISDILGLSHIRQCQEEIFFTWLEIVPRNIIRL